MFSFPLSARCSAMGLALLSPVALAQTPVEGAAESQAAAEPEELSAPVLRDIPPRYSWDVGLTVSYGMLPQFESRGWAGFGVRGTWGKNFGRHRIGPTLGVALEGQIALQWTNNFEPGVAWDFVHEKKLWLGATLGLDLALHVDGAGTYDPLVSFEPAPALGFRIGFSQPFSLVRSRFFVAIEPKIRIMGGQPQVLGVIVIGSGKGY